MSETTEALRSLIEDLTEAHRPENTQKHRREEGCKFCIYCRDLKRAKTVVRILERAEASLCRVREAHTHG